MSRPIDTVLARLDNPKATGRDRWRSACPACGGNRSALSIDVAQDDAVLLRCFKGCCFEDIAAGLGLDVRDLFPRHDGSTPAYRPGKAINRPVTPLKREPLSDYGRDLFAACTGLRDTIGEQYIGATRHAVVPPADGDLRFHPGLKHWPSGHVLPALVALGTDALTGEWRTLHFTYLTADGRKADVDPPRRLLAGHRKAGAVIRLWPDEAVTTGLAIAEGIETALSLAHAFTPVWSLIDAGNLAAMPVLAGIETLVIGADHDEAGIKAATACADRWSAAGVDVRVIAPDAERSDWNDARAAA